MKTKITIAAALSLCLFVCLAFTLPSSNKPNANAFTGEDLFKGIYFNQGKVGAILNGSTNATEQTNSRNEATSVVEAKYLVSAIKKNNPQFFADFKKIIQCGDPVSIQNCLLKGQETLGQTLSNAYDNKAMKNGFTLPGAGVAFLPYLTYVVIPPPPVIDQAFIAQVIATSANPDQLSIQKIAVHSLQTESLVNVIAVQFKTGN